MTPIQALQIILDEIEGKGGHSWLEIAEAAAILIQYALAQIKGGATAAPATSGTDVEHLMAAHAAIGSGGGLKNINWGNIIQIVLKVLGTLGPILGGATGAGS